MNWQDLAPALRAVLEASFYGSLIALLVLLIHAFARRRLPARFRFALWFVVMIRLTALPLPQSSWSIFNLFAPSSQLQPVAQASPDNIPIAQLTADLPRNVNPIPTIAPITSTPIAGSVEISEPAPIAPVPAATPLIAAPAAPAYPFPWATLITLLYLTGVGILFIRHLLATLALHKLIRRAAPATDPALLASLTRARKTLGVRRALPLLLTESLSSPAVTGIFRPRLLLPRTLAENLSTDELHFVFLHECAHVRRHDVLLNCWITLLSALHWFNPIFWLLLARIRNDRELACDELVLQHTTDPAPYGQTLLRIFETVSPLRPAAIAVGIVENRTFFARRIQMIANFRKSPRWINAAAALGLVTVAACTLTRGQDHTTALPPPATPVPADQKVADPLLPTTQAPGESATVMPLKFAKAAEAGAMVKKLVPGMKIVVDEPSNSLIIQGPEGSHDKVVALLQDLDRPKENDQQLDALQSKIEAHRAELQQLAIRQNQFVGQPEPGTDDLIKNIESQMGMIKQQIAQTQMQMDRIRQLTPTPIQKPLPPVPTDPASLESQLDAQRQSLEQQISALQAKADALAAVPPSPENQRALDAMAAQQAALQQKLADVRAFGTLRVTVVPSPASVNPVTARPEMSTHIYDIRSLVNVPQTQTAALNPDQRSAAAELVETIKSIVPDPNYNIAMFNGSLVISGSDNAQKQIEDVLNKLEAVAHERAEEAAALAAKNKQ